MLEYTIIRLSRFYISSQPSGVLQDVGIIGTGDNRLRYKPRVFHGT